ncbi:hypothetical protein BCR43DRAFT_139636 [Syncephalastrum racemosum]|uniref:Uncharacterized protein n=1 Tax=Syncephalastrum racemosum TaxID=13706 RepID=A0A1X2HM28_SYNRA|nr:hypothetical protein BCR43DRAFT_139636 [Syncephalastrum racemosum]
MFDTPPEGLRIPLSDHDNNLPRKRLSIQSNSSYQSIKSKTGTHHITTASVQTPSARHEKISSPRISSPTPHHTVHKDTETSKTDTHSTLPLGLPQSTFKQSQVEPQENEPGGLQYNQRESTPPKTVDEVASQQDSPLPGRQSSPISAYPNVSFDDDFGAYDIDDVLDAAEVDPVIDKVGNESLLQQQDRSNDVHSPSIESLDPKAQQAQEREVAIQKVRAGFSKALSNDNPESLNPNYFSRQLGDIDELIRTISRNTSGGTANFDPAVVQSTEELESNIMEQMNALVSHIYYTANCSVIVNCHLSRGKTGSVTVNWNYISAQWS